MLRTIRNLTVGGVALVVAGFAAGSSVSAATPAITVVPASAPDAYVVAGSGFDSGVAIRVVEVTWGPLPCGAGGGGSTVARASAAGTFTVTLTLNSATVPTDRDFRVIAVWPGERAGLATGPQVRVPLHHAGLPSAPATGPGLAQGDDGNDWPLAGMLAVFAIVAGSGLLLGTSAVRRKS